MKKTDFNNAPKELIDIIDDKNKLTGEKEDLREAHFKSLWHRAAHVWIYNSQGNVLLQKRAAIKNYFADLYDISAAGHIDAGEEPISCAIRETREELGLNIREEDLDFIGETQMSIPLNGYVNNEFYYTYLLKWDGDITNLKLKKDEVNHLVFIKLADFEQEIKSPKSYEKYVPHDKKYYYKIVEEIKKRLGAKQ